MHRGSAKELLKDLQSQGNIIHGHNILDKRHKPKVSTLEELMGWVRNKIEGITGVHSWDVLNEVMGNFPDDWLLAVLEEMRKLQPDSLLLWNEYALKNRDYWDRLIQLAAIAKSHGLLDGVGIQRHINLRGKLPYSEVLKPAYSLECHLKSWVNERRLSYEINRIHELGLLCHISEVSICCFPWQRSVAQRFLERLIEISRNNDAWKLTLWGSPAIKEIS
ncbi:endo-1,4-beta-xylanase [Leptolyngbya sp. Heron Island J]|uniref:endo-1,4-beta-xylanase n=1 Tax=Leptolyngbya sp. Heron Island J TaxID=1385935 RepID=UPI001378D9E9|nr:endo-1,4-beta-xylanase [Leptolyngbya sp. Heron Island J]